MKTFLRTNKSTNSAYIEQRKRDDIWAHIHIHSFPFLIHVLFSFFVEEVVCIVVVVLHNNITLLLFSLLKQHTAGGAQ